MDAVKNNRTWLAGILTAAAASLCCVVPLLAAIGGASSMASSFSWIAPYRPYLLGITILVFAVAWYQKLKPKKAEDCVCEPNTKKPFLHSSSFLAIVTLFAAAMMLFPLYAKVFYAAPKQTAAAPVKEEQTTEMIYSIKGMTCEACTEHVDLEISKLKGIVYYQTSYDSARAIVKFDKTKTSSPDIVNAIKSTGYQVISQTPIIHK